MFEKRNINSVGIKPRFVTAGIWKKVQLKFWNSAKIEYVKYQQKVLNESVANLDFIFTIYVEKSGKYQIKLGQNHFHLC